MMRSFSGVLTGAIARGPFAHDFVPKHFRLPSKTRQDFVQELDINRIISRYRATGLLRQSQSGVPLYLDHTALPGDYQHALNIVNEAQAFFMALPSEVRSRFGNDPSAFCDFAGDPANRQQLIDWKLLSAGAEVTSGQAPQAPGTGEAAQPPETGGAA